MTSRLLSCDRMAIQGVRISCFLLFGLLVAGECTAQAGGYPARAIRFVVPFSPGGVNDIVARIVAQKTGEAMRQQWVVENRPGAGGNIGTDFVAKSAPDGYTLLSGGMGSLVMNPLIARVPYDTLRDFSPIVLIAKAPNVLLVHPSLPAKTVRELVALAKGRPGQLNYGSGGVGSTPHLSAALFAVMADIDITHVPYKGTAPAITDLVAGNVQMAILGIPAAQHHIRSGRLRALALTALERSSSLPGVPTISESGLNGYEVSPWYGVLAPAGTPSAVVRKLNLEIVKVTGSAEMREKLAANGAETVPGTAPADFDAQIRSDIVKWTKVVRKAGITAQ